MKTLLEFKVSYASMLLDLFGKMEKEEVYQQQEALFSATIYDSESIFLVTIKTLMGPP